MKLPSFYEGVAVALGASLTASIIHTSLSPLFGEIWVARLVIALLGLGYVLYLLHRSSERVGKLITVAIWLVMAASAWILVPGLALYIAMHVGMVWLVRSLYYQPGVLAALADLALHVFALMAGTWAWLHSGSVLLGVWSLFLIEALFVAIPARFVARTSNSSANQAEDRFQQASQVADTALRRLSSIK